MLTFTLILLLASIANLMYTLGSKSKNLKRVAVAAALFVLAMAWSYFYDYNLAPMSSQEQKVCSANPRAVGCDEYLERACQMDPTTIGCDRIR